MKYFRHLRTKLAVLYVALFAAVLLGVAAVAHVMIANHARASVRAELAISGRVYDRIWALKSQSLNDSVDNLAHHSGFLTVIASGDRAAIAATVSNMQRQAGVSNAFVVQRSGEVIGAGSGDLRKIVSRLPFDLPDGRRDAVVAAKRGIYHVIVTSISVPSEFGWVVLTVPLDAGEMRALERLSAIPLTVTMLRRDARGSWASADGTIPAQPKLDSLMMAQDDGTAMPVTLQLPAGPVYALAKPLKGRAGGPEAAVLFSYPLAAALSSYAPLQRSLALAGLFALVLVALASRQLAAGIARPIAALDTAARALKDGARPNVVAEGRDEIGRLAQSFNQMAIGIAEREHRISHLVCHDTLTGLPNRSFFRQQIDTGLARANKFDGKVTILALELVAFRTINETFGHPVGDALLRRVGERLSQLADDGVVCRLGSDEFAILLADCGDPHRPRMLAQAILDSLRESLAIESHHIPIDASIGIAIGPDDGADSDTLLKNVDFALDRARQEGRGVFRFFEPALDAAARERRQLEFDLREALTAGQFRLAYQPILDVAADRLCGFEALLRWEHPTRGNIPPVDFISVAEDVGLIAAIGEWVLQEACRAAMAWPDPVRVAVNVSPLQFANPGFATVILQALSRSGLAPQRLEIEITESVLLGGEPAVQNLLHQLRAIGVRIALDDFGTGYSSLSYLRSFPFDKIKIDRSFVTSVTTDRGAAAIVRAIINLANTLGIDTTAEGVEEEAQFALLARLGCTSIQGYFVSPPVEVDKAPGLMGLRVRAAA